MHIRAAAPPCSTSICVAGKDRTGLVTALTLSVLGVPESAIVDDYAISDAAYKQLDDEDAMVGALAQVCSASLGLSWFLRHMISGRLPSYFAWFDCSGARADNERQE